MQFETFFDRDAVIDLSFFNFRNAITACYFADRDLRILRVNDNFRSFFPVLGNINDGFFPDVLKQLGVAPAHIERFKGELEATGHVLIPDITLTIDGVERVFSLLSAYTRDEDFPYLNGIQGQFVDRTEEHALRRERERLLEERVKDREIIEEKTVKLEILANRPAKYLSPQIYESIFSGQGDVQNNFLRKNLTVFFSDIEGFTEISDGMEPERLAFIINTYLSEMSKIAIEYGGTIDKFIGDAILIFFGDPQTEGEHNDAVRCVRMALRMRERIAELQEFWNAQGVIKPVRVRMGIATGYCTVGNFGSDQRLEYTILGGTVNMAARLQSATQPNTILVAESTYNLIRDVADCTPQGEMTPKGFIRPIATYQVGRLIVDEDPGRSVSRVGQHVSVNVVDRRNIRDAIAELKHIQEEFESDLAGPD